jgi:hypothetical protein
MIFRNQQSAFSVGIPMRAFAENAIPLRRKSMQSNKVRAENQIRFVCNARYGLALFGFMLSLGRQ